MNNTRTLEDIVYEIKDYFEDNEEEFNEIIEVMDSINGILGDDRIYQMEELDELYAGTEPSEVLRRAFFGYDYDDSYISNGREDNDYAPFNPNREYFYFNGYGNLVSTDNIDYSDKLDDCFVDDLIANRHEFPYIPSEVEELIDEYEALEEEAE